MTVTSTVDRTAARVPRTHAKFEAAGRMPVAPNTLRLTRASMARHPTLRSAPMNAGITATWWTVRNIVRLAQRADDLLHPAWRETPVDRPVFIFASARSGTTLLHRLMSLDASRWATMKLYQSCFPSVTTERAFDALQDSSSPLSRVLSAVPRYINRRYFSGWQGVHDLGLDKPEEDEPLFIFGATSQTLTLLLPYADELRDSFELDRFAEADREAFLDFYEASIRRFLYTNGHGRRLLNKNVFLGPRLRSLAGRFEDAQFIFLVRHPYESLGSYMSMWYRAWEVHRPEIAKDSEESRAFARMALAHYKEALASRKVLAARNQMIIVRYDDLARHPERTVTKLYGQLGEEVSPEFLAQLREATANQRDYQSEHTYSLEEFGITREFLFDQIPGVYAEFGFEP